MKKFKRIFVCLLLVSLFVMPLLLVGCTNKNNATYNISLSANESQGRVYGQGSYAENEEIVIYAEAKEGYVFSTWSDGNTENPRIIQILKDENLVANFVEISSDKLALTLTSSNNSHGIVYGAGNYTKNEEVLIYAEAKEGYTFSKWSDGNTENPRKITVSSNTSLRADFVEKQAYALIESINFKIDSSYGVPSLNIGETILCTGFNLAIDNDSYFPTYAIQSGNHILLQKESATSSMTYELSANRNKFFTGNGVNLIDNKVKIGQDIKNKITADISLVVAENTLDKQTLELYSEDTIVLDKTGKMDFTYKCSSTNIFIKITFIYSIVY